jgi:hypothetical protein
VLVANRNHSQVQKENCSQQELVQNDDYFVVFHIVGVMIQAGEI